MTSTSGSSWARRVCSIRPRRSLRPAICVGGWWSTGAVTVAATVAAAIAVAMLVIVVYGVIVRGASSLSLAFVTQTPQGLVEGGIFNYLLGTVEVVALGALIALPLGILTGLYLTEFAGPRSRTAGILKLALDMMQGLPTIVVGLFIYGLVVIPQHRQSGFAGRSPWRSSWCR